MLRMFGLAGGAPIPTSGLLCEGVTVTGTGQHGDPGGELDDSPILRRISSELDDAVYQRTGVRPSELVPHIPTMPTISLTTLYKDIWPTELRRKYGLRSVKRALRSHFILFEIDKMDRVSVRGLSRCQSGYGASDVKLEPYAYRVARCMDVIASVTPTTHFVPVSLVLQSAMDIDRAHETIFMKLLNPNDAEALYEMLEWDKTVTRVKMTASCHMPRRQFVPPQTTIQLNDQDTRVAGCNEFIARVTSAVPTFFVDRRCVQPPSVMSTLLTHPTLNGFTSLAHVVDLSRYPWIRLQPSFLHPNKGACDAALAVNAQQHCADDTISKPLSSTDHVLFPRLSEPPMQTRIFDACFSAVTWERHVARFGCRLIMTTQHGSKAIAAWVDGEVYLMSEEQLTATPFVQGLLNDENVAKCTLGGDEFLGEGSGMLRGEPWVLRRLLIVTGYPVPLSLRQLHQIVRFDDGMPVESLLSERWLRREADSARYGPPQCSFISDMPLSATVVVAAARVWCHVFQRLRGSDLEDLIKRSNRMSWPALIQENAVARLSALRMPIPKNHTDPTRFLIALWRRLRCVRKTGVHEQWLIDVATYAPHFEAQIAATTSVAHSCDRESSASSAPEASAVLGKQDSSDNTTEVPVDFSFDGSSDGSGWVVPEVREEVLPFLHDSVDQNEQPSTGGAPGSLCASAPHPKHVGTEGTKESRSAFHPLTAPPQPTEVAGGVPSQAVNDVSDAQNEFDLFGAEQHTCPHVQGSALPAAVEPDSLAAIFESIRNSVQAHRPPPPSPPKAPTLPCGEASRASPIPPTLLAVPPVAKAPPAFPPSFVQPALQPALPSIPKPPTPAIRLLPSTHRRYVFKQFMQQQKEFEGRDAKITTALKLSEEECRHMAALWISQQLKGTQ